MNQMLRPETACALVFGSDQAHQVYESLSLYTGTNPAAKDVIDTFPNYFSKTIQETIKMMSSNLDRGWAKLKEELRNTFRHADSRVYMSMRSYLESYSTRCI